MSDLVLGSDGELAREVGPWAEEKLFYIARYMDIFTSGMKNRWPRRVYIDLFAGPGRCVVEGTNHEFAGSPMLALQTNSPFTDLYLNDLDLQAVDALRSRTAGLTRAPLHLGNLDCNEAALDAIEKLDLDRAGTLGLAVVDPTAFQISLEALATMTKGRPVDLIVTLMTGHLRRFIAEPSFEKNLDPFFGSSSWRSLVDLRSSGSRITFRKLLDFYKDRLREIGYPIVDDDIRILNSNEQTLYHLVFATKNERGLDFFKKISQRTFDGQRRLL